MKKKYEELDVRPYALTEAFVKGEDSAIARRSNKDDYKELNEKRKNLTPEQIHEFCSAVDNFCKMNYSMVSDGDFIDFMNGKNDSWLNTLLNGFFPCYLMDNSFVAELLAI